MTTAQGRIDKYLADHKRVLTQAFDKHKLPLYMSGAISYVIEGTPVGGFLEAVLSNNLIQAAMAADDINRPKLFEWAAWVWNHVPHGAQGSHAKVYEWQAHRGLRGLAEMPEKEREAAGQDES